MDSFALEPSSPHASQPPASFHLEPMVFDDLEPVDDHWTTYRDVPALRTAYLDQNELVHTPDFVPAAVIAPLDAEARRIEPHAVRKYVPGYKKSASVSFHQLRESAPAIVAFYRCPRLRALLESVVGRPLVTCPDTDAHACALYYYTQPGDHIGWHYDTSHYAGERFTVLISLSDDSSARLLGQLHKGQTDSEPVELRLPTPPGTGVVFHGDKLYHAVSPIAENERRVVLSLEYVTDPRIGRWYRFVASLKDAIAYFGFRQWLFGRRRRTAPDPDQLQP